MSGFQDTHGVQIKGRNAYDFATLTQDGAKQRLDVSVGGFIIPTYDEIVLSYTGSNLTGVVYKLAASTVMTLTLSYTGSNLTGVVRS